MWLGLAILAACLGLPFLAGDGWMGLILASMWILLTTLWHLLAGHSWITPLLPASRKQALFGGPLALVLFIAGAVAAPATTRAAVPAATTAASSATSTPAAPQPLSPSATSPSATSPSAASTPSATSTAPATPVVTPAASAAESSAAEPSGTALAALAALPVKGRAPMTGYSRSLFGQTWADVDRNGCDTRNDILGRDLSAISYRSGTHDCVVSTGTLSDPYTRTLIPFTRGQRTSNAVQIDHVVALGDAWQTGAQQLSLETRTELANDPLNLLAVDGPTNQRKGDGDAATWLPPNKAFRCQYVARQVAVKEKYRLWVTPAEHDAIARILSTCPAQTMPSGSTGAIVTWTATSAHPSATATHRATTRPTATHTTHPTATQTRQGLSSSVYYKNCKAAWTAGVAPLHRGDPGYRSGLDRDNDGVACEIRPK